MKLATYQRALEGARRGLRGPKQRRAMRFRAAMAAWRPTTRTKRAYRRAARLGTLAMTGLGVLAAAFLMGRKRRTES